MEPKKNPMYDIHRQRGVLLNVGLIISLILVITGFKWKVLVDQIIDRHFDDPIAEWPTIEDPRITDIKTNDPAKPKPVKPIVAFPTDFIESREPSSDNQPTEGPDLMSDPVELNTGTIDIPIETLEPDTFRIVEKMPEPVGGWSTFYKSLAKNIKYPKQAERNFATGKVFVEFTVNEKGELSHFKILKGIGYGCDEEAKRVIAMTKWNPGKQRGKPVNVKMVQPVKFALSH